MVTFSDAIAAHQRAYNWCCKLRSSTLYRNALYLILNTIFTSLLGFVFWSIMARIFSHADVGMGSALLSASTLIAVLSILGFSTGLIRFIPEMRSSAIRLNNAVFTLSSIVAAIGSIVYLAGLKYWAPAMLFIDQNRLFALLFIIFTIANLMVTLLDNSFIAVRTAKYVFWKNILISILKIPLPIFLFAFWHGFGIFAGTGVSMVVVLILTLAVFMPLVYPGYIPKPVWAYDLVRELLPYSFANYIANMLSNIPAYIYPLMILNVLGPEQNAFFYIAWMMTMILTAIPGNTSQSLFAEGAHDGRKIASDGKKALLVAVALTIPAMLAMLLLGGWLLSIFGKAYADNGIGVMRFLVLAMPPYCINTFFMTVTQVRKQIGWILTQTIIMAITALGIGYLLLVRYGLNGIGMAYAISQYIVAVIVIVPLWRALTVKSDNVKEIKSVCS